MAWRRYKITLLVPHSTIIEAPGPQEAHNEASRMVNNVHPDETKPILVSIDDVGPVQSDMDFPTPAA